MELILSLNQKNSFVFIIKIDCMNFKTEKRVNFIRDIRSYLRLFSFMLGY